MSEEPKIMSIAPSFNCKLKCEGCYLTTDVTKEMRDATKGDYYWKRAMQMGVANGYTEFAMTLNPFPGALDEAIQLAKTAKKIGFQTVNVTVTWDKDWDSKKIGELIELCDVISESVDEHRESHLNLVFGERGKLKHFNLNVLWSKELMRRVNELLDEGKSVSDLSLISKHLDQAISIYDTINLAQGKLEGSPDSPYGAVKATVQHLILKPRSLYGEVDFERAYYALLESGLPIAGGDGHIGDVAYGNVLGMNKCPGTRMVDIDPMGFVRRCPENPVKYDGRTLDNLEKYLRDGVPNCNESCNCI